jgi:hypothetical protein
MFWLSIHVFKAAKRDITLSGRTEQQVCASRDQPFFPGAAAPVGPAPILLISSK